MKINYTHKEEGVMRFRPLKLKHLPGGAHFLLSDDDRSNIALRTLSPDRTTIYTIFKSGAIDFDFWVYGINENTIVRRIMVDLKITEL